MKILLAMLVLVTLAAGMPAFAAERELPAPSPLWAQAPAECAASPTHAATSWLESEPSSDGITIEVQNLLSQGCSVQSCNPGCAWCRIACDGYCTVFGGICQCE